MTKQEQFEKDCRQLGDLLLRVDGTARAFCSSIKSIEKAGIDTDGIIFQYFDTADETGESRYRIVFGITEL